MFGNRPGFAMAKGKRVGGKLALIGVDVLKCVLSSIGSPADKESRFSESLEPSYFEQLARRGASSNIIGACRRAASRWCRRVPGRSAGLSHLWLGCAPGARQYELCYA